MSLRGLFCLIATTFLGSGLRAEFRTWTSTDGTSVEAELVDLNSTHVTLKLKDGHTLRVAKDNLDEKSTKILELDTVSAPIVEEKEPEVPLELRPKIYANKSYLLRIREPGETNNFGTVIGKYIDENKKGVVIRSKGKNQLIPWENIYNTGPNKNYLDSHIFRGLVGEEIPWPAFDIKNFPDFIPGDIKVEIDPKLYPYSLTENKRIRLAYKPNDRFTELIGFRVTPPDIIPGEYIRFGVKLGKYYVGGLWGESKKEPWLPVATVWLTLENGEKVKYTLSGLVNPIGENTAPDNRPTWIKLNSKIKSCKVNIQPCLNAYKAKDDGILELIHVKVYRSYNQLEKEPK